MTYPETISAEVILKSKTGKSMFEPGVVVTSENVSDFKPDETSISKVSDILCEMGFKISCGEHSISIEGSKILFEKIFKIKITIGKDKNQTFKIKNNVPINVPSSLKNYVEKIFFPEPPEYFS